MFWNRAFNIIHGQWLGPYSNMVLPKGAAFSIFIVINYISGLSITLSIAFFFWFSVFNLSKVLINIGFNKYLIFLLYLLTLFHPAMQPIRIIRDNIYPALVLLSITGVIEIFFDWKWCKAIFLKFFFYGIALGFFFSTREEGLWVMPAVTTLVFGRYYFSRTEGKSFLSFSRPVFTLIVGTLSVILAISFLNYRAYGKFHPTDIGGQFSKAVTNLSAIDVGDEIPYVSVSVAKRRVLYEISPAFKELEEYFEGKGRAWTKYGCAIYPDSCGEYQAGWFVWALRDAVASKGYYKDAIAADGFYAKLNAELDHACKEGVVRCRSVLIP
jgi:hypothetical protein